MDYRLPPSSIVSSLASDPIFNRRSPSRTQPRSTKCMASLNLSKTNWQHPAPTYLDHHMCLHKQRPEQPPPLPHPGYYHRKTPLQPPFRCTAFPSQKFKIDIQRGCVFAAEKSSTQAINVNPLSFYSLLPKKLYLPPPSPLTTTPSPHNLYQTTPTSWLSPWLHYMAQLPLALFVSLVV